MIWDKLSGWNGGGNESCITGSGHIDLSNLGRLCSLCDVSCIQNGACCPIGTCASVYAICNCASDWRQHVLSFETGDLDSSGYFTCEDDSSQGFACDDGQVNITLMSGCRTTNDSKTNELDLNGNCGT